jgi:hypothetical protein
MCGAEANLARLGKPTYHVFWIQWILPIHGRNLHTCTLARSVLVRNRILDPLGHHDIHKVGTQDVLSELVLLQQRQSPQRRPWMAAHTHDQSAWAVASCRGRLLGSL